MKGVLQGSGVWGGGGYKIGEELNKRPVLAALWDVRSSSDVSADGCRRGDRISARKRKEEYRVVNSITGTG